MIKKEDNFKKINESEEEFFAKIYNVFNQNEENLSVEPLESNILVPFFEKSIPLHRNTFLQKNIIEPKLGEKVRNNFNFN